MLYFAGQNVLYYLYPGKILLLPVGPGGAACRITSESSAVAGQEAILIEPRKIHQSGAKREPQPSVGRQVNVNNSRRDPAPSGKPPKEPKEKSRHPLLRFLGRTLAMLICLGIMAGSLLMVGMVYYAVQATANDGDLLDLDNIELSQSSTVVATDPTPGRRWSTPPCVPPTATVSGQTWSRSPPTYSMRSSAPRTKISTMSRASTSSAPLAPWSTSMCCRSTAPSRARLRWNSSSSRT